MGERIASGDRAGRASPQAASRLDHTATLPLRKEVLRNIDRAKSGEAKRRIAKKAYDSGIILAADLMRILIEARKADQKAWKPWSAEEDRALAYWIKSGLTYELVSHHFSSRTRPACLGRAFRLGLMEGSVGSNLKRGIPAIVTGALSDETVKLARSEGRQNGADRQSP